MSGSSSGELSPSTRITLGLAITIGTLICGGGGLALMDARVAYTQLQTTAAATSAGVAQLQAEMKEVRKLLQVEYVSQRDMQILLDRFRDVNPELTVPKYPGR